MEAALEGLLALLGVQLTPADRDPYVGFDATGPLFVQRKRNDELSEKLYIGLRLIESRASEFNMSRASKVGKIDILYQDHISPLQPRIIVRGDQSYLLNEDNAAKIRTLLLAGIRAAVLWRQLGGSKWKLFLTRSKYVEIAREMSQRI